jgi:hypothetical protein
LRAEALADVLGGPDATGVALTFSPDDPRLRTLLRSRLAALRLARDGVVAERERLLAEELIDDWTATLFDRRRLLFQAEIAWIEQLPPRATLKRRLSKR